MKYVLLIITAFGMNEPSYEKIDMKEDAVNCIRLERIINRANLDTTGAIVFRAWCYKVKEQ